MWVGKKNKFGYENKFEYDKKGTNKIRERKTILVRKKWVQIKNKVRKNLCTKKK